MTQTALIATFVVDTPTDTVPDHMIHEAKRTLLNVFGVALSASQTPRSPLSNRPAVSLANPRPPP